MVTVEEGEEPVAIFVEALDESAAVRVAPFGVGDEFVEAQMDAADSGGVRIALALAIAGFAAGAPGQAQGVAEDSLEFLVEGGPFLARVRLGDLFEFAQEVDQAQLALGGDDVVSAEEVADQRALETVGEELVEHVARARGVDVVVG